MAYIDALTTLAGAAALDTDIVYAGRPGDPDPDRQMTLLQAAIALLERAADGSAAAPSVRFASDPDTGIYRDGANALAFSAGGTRRAVVDTGGLKADVGGSLFPVFNTKNLPVGYAGRDDNFSGTSYDMAYTLVTGALYLFTLLLTTGSDSRSISAILTIGGGASAQRTATVIANNGFGTNRFSALSVTTTGVTVTTTTSLTYRARSGLFAVPAGSV